MSHKTDTTIDQLNPNWVFVNLSDKGMFVSRSTTASQDIGLSCGDLVDEAQLAISPVKIEYCQMSFEQLKAYRGALSLTPSEFCSRLNISLEQLTKWEKEQ